MSKDEKIKRIEEMIQVVLKMIPKEIQSRDVYLGVYEKAFNDATRKLFKFLADQEEGHEKKLRAVLLILQKEIDNIKSGKEVTS